MPEQYPSDFILMQNRLSEQLISATITAVEWERIHMHLTVEVEYSDRFDPEKPLDFYLVAAFQKANAHFRSEKLDEHTYRLSLNVTNMGAVMCVPTGTYTIYACQGNDILCAPEVAPSLAPLLPERSRTFLHNNKTKGYCINFSVTE
ncbi:MAG: teichoic acid biosynthesis protein, partial [Clostridia bacterium]|nr:teichoic acid biosynthesis protein [Clostridia bacterium]